MSLNSEELTISGTYIIESFTGAFPGTEVMLVEIQDSVYTFQEISNDKSYIITDINDYNNTWVAS